MVGRGAPRGAPGGLFVALYLHAGVVVGGLNSFAEKKNIYM